MKSPVLNSFFSLVFVLLVVSNVGAGTSAPEWTANSGTVDADGVIGLSWEHTSKVAQAPVQFYQLHENYAKEKPIIHQLESSSARLQRQRPGLYQFKLISCSLTETEEIKCSEASATLEVKITSQITEKAQRPVQGKRDIIKGVGIKAGQFVPGMYKSSV
ncbi:MAG: hypothetical protein L3J22_11110, partial [Xanthomonadales bacterium]|nr:hypothetical protein [Xanthomonadales bacterium]